MANHCRKYLRMLDGTLREPFFPRRANGAIIQSAEDDMDPEGISQSINLDLAADDTGFDEVTATLMSI